MKRVWIVVCGCLWAACSQPAGPPNIVLILADDLAWSDVGVDGGRFADTPSIDRLASQGMRFTNAYAAAPICSPSRGAILTARSPARLNFEFVTKPRDAQPTLGMKLLHPPFTRDLPLEEVTIAEVLREAGYRTAMFGKWHLNEHYQRYLGYSPTHGPERQGFDLAVEDRGSHPYSYEEREFGDIADGEFPEDALTAGAIGFLEEHHERPFFLYVSHYYVHTPVHTKARWLYEKYRARFESFEDPGAGLEGMSAPSDVENAAMYGAFIETLDHYVGQLLEAIDELGLSENTVVIFTSDNGGHPEYSWNAPLRGSKWNLYEGGVREPLIVRRPGRIEAGAVRDTPVIAMDVLPTVAELAGVELDAARAIDGVSLAGLLEGTADSLEREALIWHFPYYHPEHTPDPATEPQSSIRKGDWKLIRYYDSERVELFNLGEDRSEQNDLSGAMPERAGELAAELDERLRDVGARLPTPNPGYRAEGGR